MKTMIFRSSWLVLFFAGALVAPAQLPAQRGDSTRSHVVRRGETLWTLADRYLGNSQRWREILALNPSLRSATELPVGTTIRIPKVAPGTAPQSRDTVRRSVVTDSPRTMPRSTRDPVRRTIFYGAQPAGGFTRQDSVRRVSIDSGVPARVYEAASAPFVVAASVLDGAGQCLSVGPTGAAEARGVLLHGTLTIQLPAGARPDTGTRWLLVRRGPVLEGLGAVAIPTGIVRLTSPGVGPNAEIVAQYDVMSCSDVVLRADLPAATPRGRPAPVTDGPVGRVAWVASESMLPTLQHALILDIGAESGVKPGDRITIYGGNGSAIVASADIVRVDAQSSTALVVRQSLGSLAAGQRVRVTEKLP